MDSIENPPFACAEGDEILRVHHFAVRRDILTDSDGNEYIRDIEVHKGSVAVVAMTVDHRVALVRQYRFPLRRWTIELPAGGIDEGETAEQTAFRELGEETGLAANSVRLLTRFANSPGHSTQWTTVFLAEECTVGEAHPSGPDEQGSSVVLMPLEECMHLIERGEIIDAKSIIGLTTAMHNLAPIRAIDSRS